MTDKIILNITHSDDYTDYLFQTASLTNKRIVPLVNPDQGEIARNSDTNTLVLHCINLRKEIQEGESPLSVNTTSKSVKVLSRYYLSDDGTIDSSNAQMIRSQMEHAFGKILFDNVNLREVFHRNFPLLWARRRRIIEDPKLYFVFCGRYGGGNDGYTEMPLGAILKSMEENGSQFRLSLGGGCDCREKPLIIDYDETWGEDYAKTWRLYTWCPVCQSRREIKAWNFQRAASCDRAMELTRRECDKGQGLSGMTLFDVIDTLRSA